VSHYKREKDGEWFKVKRIHRLMCCDCKLVHDVQFRLGKNNQIEMKATRNNRATGQTRRYADGTRNALG